MNRPILPPRLRRGDTVAVFAPSGPAHDPNRIEEGARLLREMGLRVRLPECMDTSHPYLAAGDQERAAELHRLWADDEIRALIALRGGYGCMRLLPLLDLKLLARRPLTLIGFSDLTVLLNHLVGRCGQVCWHGPMLTTLAASDQDSRHSLFQALFERDPEPIRPHGLEVLRGGEGRGALLGGNLCSLVHLLATPHAVALDNAILVIEDVGEPLYRLDRMLTQFQQAGQFDRLAGLLLGSFDQPGDDRLWRMRHEEAVWQRVLELCHGQDFPIWAGFPSGHGRENRCLPLGMEAVMDGYSGTLRFRPESVIMA